MKRAAAAVVLAAVALAAWWLWPNDGAPTVPRSAVQPAAPGPSEHVPRIVRVAGPVDGGAAEARLWVIAADTGAPVVGARVVADELDDVVRSDAQGAVVFPWSGGELEISAPFMKLRQGTFRVGETVELEPLAMVRGEVFERTDGPDKIRPVAGAEVTSTTPPFTQTVSGPDGKFVLKVAEAIGHLAARKGDRFGRELYSLHGEPDDAFILLEAARVEDGTVVDGKDQPIAGVAVAWSAGTISEQQVTGADGKWKMPAWDQQVTVTATKDGFLPYQRGPSSHPGRMRSTVIRLFRPAAIAGVVQTPDGRAVAGAEVEAGDASAISGPDGRFALAGFSPQIREVSATLGARSGAKEVTLTEGTNAPVVVVIAPELYDTPLRLVDAAGAEVACRTATATPIPAEGWTSDYDFDRKVLPLRPGRFRIEVRGDDDQVGEATVDVRPPAVVTIAVHRDPDSIEPEPQRLTVRVKTPSGVAVGGASVVCVGTKGTTREDGTFGCELSPYLDRPVRITARKGLAGGVVSAFGAERELDLIVKPARALRGKITGPLPAGALHLSIHSAFEAASLPLSGPEFVLTDRLPVRTMLCVGQGAERLGCTLAEDQDEISIPVGPPGAFTVTVLDEKGAPLEAPVFYVSRQGYAPALAKGVATVTSPPGTYLVVVNARGTKARAETVVTIRSGETTQLGTLQLK